MLDPQTVVATSVAITNLYFAVKRGLKSAKKVTEDGVAIAQEIVDAIHNHMKSQGDSKGLQTFELYKDDPDTFESAFQKILTQYAQQNENLFQQLAALNQKFEEASPVSEITTSVSVSIGGNVTGSTVIGAGGDVTVSKE